MVDSNMKVQFRRPLSLLAVLSAFAIAGCTAASTSQQMASHSAVIKAVPNAEETEMAAEIERLRAAFHVDVPQSKAQPPTNDATWTLAAKRQLLDAGIVIHRPQLVVVVDRNPQVQELQIMIAEPDSAWQVIGDGEVSTGQAGRRGYFLTPTGVFIHDASILDYRALGTFNEHHIRGLGLKGMRVWDFGWQRAEKGWTLNPETAEIRLALHATDPDYLEPRLGQPASKGCIRISAAMNRFLDRYGVLDRDYKVAARDDPRFQAILSDAGQGNILAGDKLIVIDSSLGDQ